MATHLDAFDKTVSVPKIGDDRTMRLANIRGEACEPSQVHWATSIVSLSAVQDPDVYETACGDADACGIGQCVSTCEHECDARFDCEEGKAGAACRAEQQSCKQACVCDCKLALPASCPAHLECLE